jgi:hypothetical protein
MLAISIFSQPLQRSFGTQASLPDDFFKVTSPEKNRVIPVIKILILT